MRTWSFYHPQSGEFLNSRYRSNIDDHLKINTPDGYVAIEGEFDHLSQRVDVANGTVIDWQPPRPTDEHEWNGETKRWQLNSSTLATQRAKEQARSRIQQLDSKSTRALRELALGINGAHERLRAIEDELQALRHQVSGK